MRIVTAGVHHADVLATAAKVSAFIMQEYQDLAGRLFAENPNVKRFKTLVVLDRVNVGLEVPVA